MVRKKMKYSFLNDMKVGGKYVYPDVEKAETIKSTANYRFRETGEKFSVVKAEKTGVDEDVVLITRLK